MQYCRQLIVLLCAALWTSCDNPFSSVPRYPVSMTVDTHTGIYVHFTPEALNTFVLLDCDGYHYNGHTEPLTVMDAYGYGGVVLYVDMLGNYNAWDIACPNCASKGRRQPCDIDAPFALCPHCGEQYDLGSGTSAPQKGIAKEFLLRLPVVNSGGRITVKQ